MASLDRKFLSVFLLFVICQFLVILAHDETGKDIFIGLYALLIPLFAYILYQLYPE